MRKKDKFVPIAAAVSGMGEAAHADQELSAVASRRREGFTLAGTVWRNKVQTGSHCFVMDLEDLATGARPDISTPLARGGADCEQ
jgi:hypothetical protein